MEKVLYELTAEQFYLRPLLEKADLIESGFKITFYANEINLHIDNWTVYEETENIKEKDHYFELIKLFKSRSNSFGLTVKKNIKTLCIEYQKFFIEKFDSYLKDVLSISSFNDVQHQNNLKKLKQFRTPSIIVLTHFTPGTVTKYKRGEGWWDEEKNYYTHCLRHINLDEFSAEFFKEAKNYLNKISRFIETDYKFRNYSFKKTKSYINIKLSRYLIQESREFSQKKFPERNFYEFKSNLLQVETLKFFLFFMFCDYEILLRRFKEWKDESDLYCYYLILLEILEIFGSEDSAIRGKSHLMEYFDFDIVDKEIGKKFPNVDINQYLTNYLINFEYGGRPNWGIKTDLHYFFSSKIYNNP